MKFEHPHFRRERPDLMQLVHRTCLSGGGTGGRAGGRRTAGAGEPLSQLYHNVLQPQQNQEQSR